MFLNKYGFIWSILQFSTHFKRLFAEEIRISYLSSILNIHSIVLESLYNMFLVFNHNTTMETPIWVRKPN